MSESQPIFPFLCSAATLAGLALMMAFAIMVYGGSSPSATPEELASVLALKAEAAQRSMHVV
jgi:hypothetical protein